MAHEPCTQENNIININTTLERMWTTQERLVVALERVADQGARVDNLEKLTDQRHKDLQILYERVRDAELVIASDSPQERQKLTSGIERMEDRLELLCRRLDRINKFMSLATHKYAVAIYLSILAMIASGTLIDMICHRDVVEKIIHFVRG